jgi:hypothetical protein
MIDRTLEAIDKNRHLPKDQQFVWTVPGWPMAQMLWSGQDPQRKARIEEAFRAGNLAIHALPFTTHTETLGLEELVRGMVFSSQLARAYGLELPRGSKMTDVCEHTWVIPTILKHAGVDFFHIGANFTVQQAAVPMLFWWEGPDGSRLLTMYSHDYGTTLLPPSDWHHATWLALLHTGDNQGPPQPEYVKQVLDELHQKMPSVKVKIGQLSDFYDALMAEKPELPVVRGEMTDVWIHGPMSAPAGCKIAQDTRPMIGATEILGTLLKTWGVKGPDLSEAIAKAYEKSLLYGEHTWGLFTQIIVDLPYGKAWDDLLAKGLPEPFQRCEASWDEHEAYIKDAQALIAPLLGTEISDLARSVHVDGRRIVVFNSLPWKRSGIVTVNADAKQFPSLKAAGDDQTIAVAAVGPQLQFVACDIPPLGYRTYVAAEKESPDATGLSGDATSAMIESPFFKAKLDPVRGSIISLVDKRTGRELVNQKSSEGFGQYLYERYGKKEIDKYIADYIVPQWVNQSASGTTKSGVPDVPYHAETAKNMTLRIDQSAVAVTATMSTPATEKLPHAVSIALILYRDLPAADLEVTFEKKPDGWPEAGWICLPLNIESPTFHLGRLGSIIDPMKDIIEGCNFHFYWLHSGMTVTDATGSGLGVCPIDTPLVSLGEPGAFRYSKRYVPQNANVYVNLFNNQYHTNFRSWWGGKLTSRVRLWTCDTYSPVDALYQPAMEARTRLLAAESDGPAGSLPASQSGIELSRNGVAVTAFGPNPDGAGTILRLWEQSGQSGDCTVHLPVGIHVSSIQPIDLRGRNSSEAIPVANSAFTFPLPAFAPASFLLNSK